MNSHSPRLRRLTAGLGTLALALSGVVGAAGAASATGNGGFPLPGDDTGTLTVHKHVEDERSTDENPAGAPLEGVEFTAQQLGTGAPCVAVNLNTFDGWESAAAAIAAFDPSTGAIPAGFCAVGAPLVDTTDASGEAVFSGIKGLFLVTETAPGDNLISGSAEPFLVTVPRAVYGDASADPATIDSWSFDVHAYPKNTLTTTSPTKTVAATTVGGDVVDGADVNWTITAPIPMAAFPYHEVTVTDTPATGHTFKEFGAVTLGVTLLTPVTDYTVSGSTITLTASGLAKVNAIVTGPGATAVDLTVEVTTTVGATSIGELVNESTLTLNGVPTDSTVPQTNWGKLVVNKHESGDTAAHLAGAHFKVFAKDGATCAASTGTALWTGTTDASGQLSLTLWISNTNEGAAPGTRTYCLQETQAPDGYLLDDAPREAVITTAGTATVTIDYANVKVERPPLPLTGSTGTMAFGLIGLGLIAAAGATLAIRRRRVGSSE